MCEYIRRIKVFRSRRFGRPPPALSGLAAPTHHGSLFRRNTLEVVRKFAPHIREITPLKYGLGYLTHDGFSERCTHRHWNGLINPIRRTPGLYPVYASIRGAPG
jgi:hypothetical protein